MEFATEMVIRAVLEGLVIAQVPVVHRPDGRARPSHLRPWRDGWRHLRLMLLFSPLWLFLAPGLAAIVAGGAIGSRLLWAPWAVGPLHFDTNAILVCMMAIVVGFQLCVFAISTRTYAEVQGFLPPSPRLHRFYRRFDLERGLALGLVMILAAGHRRIRPVDRLPRAS